MSEQPWFWENYHSSQNRRSASLRMDTPSKPTSTVYTGYRSLKSTDPAFLQVVPPESPLPHPHQSGGKRFPWPGAESLDRSALKNPSWIAEPGSRRGHAGMTQLAGVSECKFWTQPGTVPKTKRGEWRNWLITSDHWSTSNVRKKYEKYWKSMKSGISIKY